MKFLFCLYSSSKSAAIANLFSQGGLAVIQLISVPFCMMHWGGAVYGEWVLIYGLVGVFAVLDGGIVGVSGGKLLLALAKNSPSTAAESIKLGVCVLLCVIFSLTILFLLSLFLPDNFFPKYIESASRRLGLFVYVGFLFFYILISGFVQAVGGVANAAWMGAVTSIFEACVAPIAAYFGFGLDHALLIISAIRFLSLVFVLVLFWMEYSKLKSSGLIGEFCKIPFPVFKEALQAGLSSLSVGLAITIQLQMPLWVINAALGAAAVSIYSSVRLVSRLPVQVGQAFVKAYTPKYAINFHQNKFKEAKTLLVNLFYYAFFVLIPIAILQYAFGDKVFENFIKDSNKIYYLNGVIIFLSLAAVFNFIWTAIYHIQFSVFLHQKLALVVGAATLLLAIIFNYSNSLGIIDVAVCVFGVDFFIGAFAVFFVKSNFPVNSRG